LLNCNVVKYFGLPSNIMSDCDVWFMSKFSITLFNMIGTKLKFFSVNHP
jgi:hypothetical protein